MSHEPPPHPLMPSLLDFLELEDEHAPALPPLPERQLGIFGKLIQSIHTSNLGYRAPTLFKLAQKVIKVTLAVLVSGALLYSFFGAPIFIMGFKEYIEQLNRSEHDRKFETLFEAATTNCKARFLDGRLSPLNHASIKLKDATIRQMARDLEACPRLMMYLYHEDQAVKTTARQYLIRKAAVRHVDYLSRYNFKIAPKSWLPSVSSIFVPPLEIETSAVALPDAEKQMTGTIGKSLEWIQDVARKGVVYEVAVQITALVLSTFLIWSLVGIPLFLIGFYEFTYLREQTFYHNAYGRLQTIAKEQQNQKFLEGRIAPLTNAKVHLGWNIRRQIYADYPMIQKKQDNLLLATPAADRDNFLEKYGLQLRVS